MEAVLRSENGTVQLQDSALLGNIISFTPAEAIWFAEFLQQHLISELIVQLKLAALFAQSPNTTKTTFPLKRS